MFSHTSLHIDFSDLKKTGDAVNEIMDKDFLHNKTALAQLRKLEKRYDEALRQGYGYKEVSVDELMQEMLNAKKDGKKPH